MELTKQEISLIEGIRKFEILPSILLSDARRGSEITRKNSEYAEKLYSKYHSISEDIRKTY